MLHLYLILSSTGINSPVLSLQFDLCIIAFFPPITFYIFHFLLTPTQATRRHHDLGIFLSPDLNCLAHYNHTSSKVYHSLYLSAEFFPINSSTKIKLHVFNSYLYTFNPLLSIVEASMASIKLRIKQILSYFYKVFMWII